ncbi:MAG: 3-phosphoshikimate 1-carboxyvinyltransferase [Pseudomonadota bacterium]|nr:3-phosphoshikimate 1-carboxyvinyltransferase [Pseudomonadota bacterium]
MSPAQRQDWLATRAQPLRGSHGLPGDKSISHRAIMLAALADGVSRIDGFLEGADTQATQAVFGQLGVRIDIPSPSQRIVHGVGIDGLQSPAGPLDCGNAGTAMRLLAGLLCGQRFDSALVGDASLSARPMQRVMSPLRRMGARIASDNGQTAPLRIGGGAALQGIDFVSEVASAQVKSAVLLAGLYARGETSVREPRPTRDYTERMLAAFGWPVSHTPGQVRLSGGHRLSACAVAVPGDFSSAAFLLVAATLVPGSDLILHGVGVDPRRTGLLPVLRAMGADILELDRRGQGGETVADLRVRHAPLCGIEVPEQHVADMIDEFPVLAVAASCARASTVIRGAAELRVKESDRIAAMASGLRAMGIEVVETPDGARIVGGRLAGAAVDSCGDHRVAMAFAVAGQVAREPVVIRDVGNVATSFPGFLALAQQAGFGLQAH